MRTAIKENMSESPDESELQPWQKRWAEFLLEAKRTDSKIVLARGRRGSFWTLKRSITPPDPPAEV